MKKDDPWYVKAIKHEIRKELKEEEIVSKTNMQKLEEAIVEML
jgi:hypothetical protein